MSRDAIEQFLRDYRERCEDEGAAPLPAASLRAVLQTFIFDELWEDPDPTRLSVAIASLRRLVGSDQVALRLLGVIEQETAALQGRLERQRSLNMDRCEDLLMLGPKEAQDEPKGNAQ